MHPRPLVIAVAADARPGELESTPIITDPRNELTNRPRERLRAAVLAEWVGKPHLRAACVVNEVRIDIHDAVRSIEYRARIVERHAGDRPVARRTRACPASRRIARQSDFVAHVDRTPHDSH